MALGKGVADGAAVVGLMIEVSWPDAGLVRLRIARRSRKRKIGAEGADIARREKGQQFKNVALCARRILSQNACYRWRRPAETFDEGVM